MDRNSPIIYEKVDREDGSGTFEKVAALDAICFNQEAGYEGLTADTIIYGDIYGLWENDRIIGYAIYGQVWLPELSDAYIARIGVHPHHRQHGYGLKILNAIISDLSSRSQPKCPTVYADIRKRQYRVPAAL